ncbi:SsgA family sporulation/cell division regulator [Geodermatophilus ruber]|uniref:Streptomyces sporulation and cell division protein, SsgA n=1 Tax=Geodermatophilus ruber TaxID=504800 RepID=A0A1I4FJI0_9ACTN|nr:SsgA family sporulation/cell division regulator [Geodermatophilus ruber]SFL17470.1 Streptomyces sporulation and cell division protein, SsgA [Geodermatophilus ruber]
MVSRSTPGYTCPTTLHLVGPQSWTEVPALLSYEISDPFAVRITFGDSSAGGGEGISWLVGRELLRTGLDRPAGEGDVRLWPSRTSGDVLYLHLRAPSGEALFEVSRGTVAGFLRLTESIVPAGEESSVLEVDDELAALLSNGGADPTGR